MAYGRVAESRQVLSGSCFAILRGFPASALSMNIGPEICMLPAVAEPVREDPVTGIGRKRWPVNDRIVHETMVC